MLCLVDRYFLVNDIIETKRLVIEMNKTSNLYVRVELGVKEQAEAVLKKLGISMSAAISIFLKQIITQDGLPFDVKVKFNKPISILDLKEDEFNLELAKAESDFENGKVYNFNEFKKETLKDIGENIQSNEVIPSF